MDHIVLDPTATFRRIAHSRASISFVRLHFLSTLLLLTIFWLVPTNASANTFCEKDWRPSVGELQEARARIKSNSLKNASARIKCAKPIVAALSGKTIDPACALCEREYVALLKDVGRYARDAAEQSASLENKQKLYRYEIDVRQSLGAFLTTASDRTLFVKDWQSNFEALGDAMERIGSGSEFHRLALVASTRGQISQKSYETWARAIRSCQDWNFQSGRNRDLAGLKKVLLCVDECKLALTKIRQRATSGTPDSGLLINDILDTLLPALAECPVVERHE